MERRRSRANKAPSVAASDDSAAATTGNARALRTLPSAFSTQRLARSQSKISELLDHAHHHVELAMRLCDGDEASGSAGGDDWPSMADTARGELAFASGSKHRKMAALIRVVLHKKKRLVDWSGKSRDDARYNRLQQGHATAVQHLKDTRASRQALEEALAAFRTQAQAMELVLPPEPRDSRIMKTSLLACFSNSTGLVDEITKVLATEVAAQTQTKMDQLDTFSETLARRERLYVDTQIAKHQVPQLRRTVPITRHQGQVDLTHHGYFIQLEQFQKLKLKQRSAIPGAFDLELAQRKHEYNTLRRRLAALTSAMEHVFQFHAHLDQCMVDPEITTVHGQLTRLFEKHARVFEKNLK